MSYKFFSSGIIETIRLPLSPKPFNMHWPRVNTLLLLHPQIQPVSDKKKKKYLETSRPVENMHRSFLVLIPQATAQYSSCVPSSHALLGTPSDPDRDDVNSVGGCV